MKARPFVLGQYRPLDSLLHRLDARAKVIVILAVMVFGLLSQSALYNLLLFALIIVGLLASRITPVTLARNLSPLILLVAVTALFHLIFSGDDSETLVSILNWDISVEAGQMAALYSLRLLLFISLAFLITLTTSPSDLADAFATGIRPLEKLRVPVYDLALIVFLAIRFIPVLYFEFETIRNAQTLRGMRFDGSLMTRIRRTAGLLIPVFTAALQRADELADAIQMRGYGRKQHRTLYSNSRFGAGEVLFALSSVAVVAALYYLTR